VSPAGAAGRAEQAAAAQLSASRQGSEVELWHGFLLISWRGGTGAVDGSLGAGWSAARIQATFFWLFSFVVHLMLRMQSHFSKHANSAGKIL
jgi:hypothetical protein